MRFANTVGLLQKCDVVLLGLGMRFAQKAEDMLTIPGSTPMGE